MLKNLPPQALNFYIDIIQEFWNNKDFDLSSWHTTILNTIYKGKGDPQDPHNHRGIALKETSAKVLSIIIAQRLLRRFKQIKTSSQFGHIGCQEAQHTIKKLSSYAANMGWNPMQSLWTLLKPSTLLTTTYY
jgi:hypothetical protein